MEANRTFIGSVVCVDLVGYSKRTVAQQGEIKQAFNKLLMQAIRKVPVEDRIILDTGDGAAISFLGDPEESLAIGLKLRDTMNGAAAKLGGAEPDGGPVRIGINLGPLRVAEDMNGRPKIIGDGINVAEKVCGFAKPGQIVVSRPFHDMVSRISDKHREIFHYEGTRTDKNVREHEIYSVLPVASEVAAPPKSKTLPPVPPPKIAEPPRPAGEGALVTFLRDPKKWGAAAVVLVGIIGYELSIIAGHANTHGTPTPPEIAKAPEPAKVAEAPKKVEPPKVEPPPKAVETPKKVEAPKLEPPKIVEPAKKAEAPKPEPPRKVETKPEPKAEPKPEPPKPPVVEKKAAPKVEEPPRVIPPPRTPPPTFAPPATTSPAPTTQPAEPVPQAREEPKPVPPPAPAPPTTVANPVTRVPVTFPLAAVNRGIESGVVRARLTINAAGAVTEVNILSADPPQVFNRAATAALEAWKFNPGADKRTYEVEIEFKR